MSCRGDSFSFQNVMACDTDFLVSLIWSSFFRFDLISVPILSPTLAMYTIFPDDVSVHQEHFFQKSRIC